LEKNKVKKHREEKRIDDDLIEGKKNEMEIRKSSKKKKDRKKKG